MSDVDSQTGAPARARKIKWAVIGLLLLVAAIVIMNLPRGFSDDLTRIGKGKAAVVLVRDKSAVQSFDLIDMMNGIRDQYAGKVEFLLTDFNTPEGRAFMTANGAERVTVTVFDANGSKVNILYPPQTAESMQQAIETALKGVTQKTSDGTTSQSTRLSKDNSQVAGYGRPLLAGHPNERRAAAVGHQKPALSASRQGARHLRGRR
jgi:hypothetical protein